MDKHRSVIIDKLEAVDNNLRSLDVTLEIMAMGTPMSVANGEEIAEILTHIRFSLQDVRAGVDEALSAVMQLPGREKEPIAAEHEKEPVA